MSKDISKKLKTPEAKLSPADLDFEKLNGLLPVIAQDESSGAVLMLAYANREAVQTNAGNWLCTLLVTITWCALEKR